ncbi:MAG: signal peptidase I [Flavobacteriales bacterium]|nr:signal peptidase I [Flavobacteriales bacterium]
MSFLRRHWQNDWLRAFALAVGVLLVLHLFVVRFINVQSTSMTATLWPGDLLLVARWPKWTGLDHGDIVVFRDPVEDHAGMSQRSLLVKRVMAVPGDELEIRRGVVYVNGKRVREAEGISYSYLVRLRPAASAEALLHRLGLPLEVSHGVEPNIELPLSMQLADLARKDSAVESVEPMTLARGARSHIFPFSPRYPWNGDDYGPITVPGTGDTLRITVDNLPLYDRVISTYEGHRLGAAGNELTIDDRPLEEYAVEQDYYFVLGDSRHYSADSRYWGFLPASHVVGRVSHVLVSGDRGR